MCIIRRVTDRLTSKELLNLTDERVSAIIEAGDEAVRWALLELSAIARRNTNPAVDPATPSSMVPTYKKPAKKKSKKARKPGRKAGHKGQRRPAPEAIDEREEHFLEYCPDCGGAVAPTTAAPRTRIVEDIEATRAKITEHVIHSHYCPRCRKRVEPKILEALPKATIGNRTLAATSWLHYALGNTTSQVVDVLNSLFHFPISAGGLTQMWARAAEILEPWYEQIAAEANDSAVMYADETGWRVNGKTHWLWCFTNPNLTYYIIDESRGSRVLKEFFGEAFAGTLVSDFFSAYNAFTARRRQTCLAHFLREIKKVSQENTSDEWVVFAQSLKRIFKDALRLGARSDRDTPNYNSKRACIEKRIDRLADGVYENADAARLVKRLLKHREHLLVFLYDPEVAPDNNRAEREIRPAVIARKNSFHNMSPRGARTQSILMSVYRTLKLRGHDPIATIADAMSLHIAGGKAPPLPSVREPTPRAP
jgi:transposase